MRVLIEICKKIYLYGVFHGIWIAVCLIATWLFFPGARLVRIPIFIRGRRNISFGRNFTCGYLNRIDFLGTNGTIKFGERVQINDYCHIAAVKSISIGDDVLIASRVFIADHDHGVYSGTFNHSHPLLMPAARQIQSSAVVIENRVWIGEGASILSGVRVGEGSVIGTGAIVTNDIPENSIAVGVPAKVIAQFDAQSGKWIRCSGEH